MRISTWLIVAQLLGLLVGVGMSGPANLGAARSAGQRGQTAPPIVQAHLPLAPNQTVVGYDPRLTATPDTLTAGGAVTITGVGFAPGELLFRWLIRPDGSRLDFTPATNADAQGRYQRVLSGFSLPGRYAFSVEGVVSQREVVADFTVVG